MSRVFRRETFALSLPNIRPAHRRTRRQYPAHRSRGVPGRVRNCLPNRDAVFERFASTVAVTEGEALQPWPDIRHTYSPGHSPRLIRSQKARSAC